MGKLNILVVSLLVFVTLALSEEQRDITAKLLKVSVPFIKNEGQYPEEVSFYAKTFVGTVFVTKKGKIVYSLPADEGNGVAIVEEFPSLKEAKVEGEEKTTTKVNLFKGKDPKKWKRNITTFKKVKIGEVAKGVELMLKAYGDNVEKLFYVKPGADPKKIVVKVEGGKGLRINERGELVVKTEYWDIRFTKPVAYQEVDGKKKYVEVSYVLLNKDTYGFKVENYDRNRMLVIDPLIASTFLGGNNEEKAYSITLDSSGNVYVAGYTNSIDFPTTTGTYQTTYGGGSYDVFISKFDSNLTTLIASTFLGGGRDDRAYSITLDSSGNVYVAGETDSNDFPTTLGAYQTTFGGGFNDVFISKLDSNLTTLIASTFLGGGDRDEANSIVLDSSGNVYVAGITGSTDFPTTTGTYQTTFGGSYDVFISKLDSNLTTLIASTFLGKSGSDLTYSITLDRSGNVYVAGFTTSNDFPITTGAYQTTFGGGFDDVFISKLDSNLTTLIASTFLGGGKDDRAYSITIDSSGNVYVAGRTTSSDFPTTMGAYLTIPGGGWSDAFISKLDSNLTTLIASTYLGGSGWDTAYSITIDNHRNVYVAGGTDSNDFPTAAGTYQAAYGGGGDAFISKLDSNFSRINNTPVINSFNVYPTSGTAPLTVNFSWNVSDPDGDTLTCTLDINNDGNAEYTINDCANNTSQAHTYSTAGTYTAVLTVNDYKGGSISHNVQVTVNAFKEPPANGDESEGRNESGGKDVNGDMEREQRNASSGCYSFNSDIGYIAIFILLTVLTLAYKRRITI